MSALSNIEQHLADLQAELKKAESERQVAMEAEREQKLGMITVLENEAVGYRNQATKPETTDADKKKLYTFANNSENEAAKIRAELGLEPVFVEEKPVLDARNKTFRKINGLLIKSLFTLVGFMFADFTASQLEAGFISYALESLAQILFFTASAFGGSWLVCTILFRFVSDYTVNELADDFKGLSPLHKLLLLAGLAAALLHFLNATVPHGV